MTANHEARGKVMYRNGQPPNCHGGNSWSNPGPRPLRQHRHAYPSTSVPDNLWFGEQFTTTCRRTGSWRCPASRSTSPARCSAKRAAPLPHGSADRPPAPSPAMWRSGMSSASRRQWLSYWSPSARRPTTVGPYPITVGPAMLIALGPGPARATARHCGTPNPPTSGSPGRVGSRAPRRFTPTTAGPGAATDPGLPPGIANGSILLRPARRKAEDHGLRGVTGTYGAVNSIQPDPARQPTRSWPGAITMPAHRLRGATDL